MGMNTLMDTRPGPADGPQPPPMVAIAVVLVAIVLADLALAVTHHGAGAHKAKAAPRVATGPAPVAGPGAKRAPSTLPLFTAPPTSSGAGTPAASSAGAGSPSGPSGQQYTITQSVPVLDSPSAAGTTLETIAAGAQVAVQCKASGTVVNGPWGPDPWWDKVTYASATGYVTDEYVDTKGDESDPTKVPQC